MNDETQKGFEMILHAGNAKSLAMAAMELIEHDDFIRAKEELDKAERELIEAHQVHKEFLDALANGQSIEMDLILTHALDHLTTAETMCIFAQKLACVYQRIGGEKQ